MSRDEINFIEMQVIVRKNVGKSQLVHEATFNVAPVQGKYAADELNVFMDYLQRQIPDHTPSKVSPFQLTRFNSGNYFLDLGTISYSGIYARGNSELRVTWELSEAEQTPGFFYRGGQNGESPIRQVEKTMPFELTRKVTLKVYPDEKLAQLKPHSYQFDLPKEEWGDQFGCS